MALHPYSRRQISSPAGSQGRWLGARGAAMLGSRDIAAMLKHHRMRYRGLTDLLALFRGELAETDLGCYWAPMPAPPMPPSPNAAR